MNMVPAMNISWWRQDGRPDGFPGPLGETPHPLRSVTIEGFSFRYFRTDVRQPEEKGLRLAIAADRHRPSPALVVYTAYRAGGGCRAGKGRPVPGGFLLEIEADAVYLEVEVVTRGHLLTDGFSLASGAESGNR